MKVALIRKDFLLSWGGAERYTVELSRELARTGIDVHVITRTWEGLPPKGVVLHPVPTWTAFSAMKNLSFAWFAQRLLSRERFDLVHALSPSLGQDIVRVGDGLHRCWLRAQHPNPFWRFLKSLSLRHQAILYLERQLFAPGNCPYVITNSEMCRRQVMSTYNVPGERVETIYNGTDHSRFNPTVKRLYRKDVRNYLSIPEDATVVLFVSRNYRRKGLRFLVESLALAKPSKGSVKVLVVGRGNRRPYQRLARLHGMGDCLLFTGETQEIERYYGASDFLVLPTLYDPFSNVCLEAMACGLPVITTRSNGASEIIEEGTTGFVVEKASDTRGLSEKISLLLNRSRREEMGAGATESSQRFTVSENATRTRALYRKVIGEKPAAARENPSPLSFSREGELTINQHFSSLLSRSGLARFDALFRHPGGRMAKEGKEGRSTVAFSLPNGGQSVPVFLKRYEAPTSREICLCLLKGTLPRTAHTEWERIVLFHRLRLPTMVPIAVGLRRRWGLPRESLILTREIEKACRLDDFATDHFTPPLSRERMREKRALIADVAAWTRTMHGLGINHRDCYLCHILIRRNDALGRHLFFVDLHRAEKHKRLRERWKIKDLAALNFSSPKGIVTRTDRLRFLRAYVNDSPTARAHRPLIRKVVAKTEKIDTHHQKTLRRAHKTAS